MSKISAGYRQLAAVFEALENARFQPDKDFGANLVGCFSWYLSPAAFLFLENKQVPCWLGLKTNPQFSWSRQKWQGYFSEAVEIKLVL